MSQDNKIYDVIIIGAGPAGMSAGIYVCRKKLTALILAKDLGGQAAKSWVVENYLGYSVISGHELMKKFKEHLDSFKCVEFKAGSIVNAIKKSGNNFLVSTAAGEFFSAKSVIIATGRQERALNVPGESDFVGRGISYCSTCDAPLFKDKTVAVVGGGNSALQAVYQLSKIASQTYLLLKDSEFKKDVDQVLLSKVKGLKKVKIIYNAKVMSFFGKKFVSGLEYEDKSGKTQKLAVTGVFLEIGSVPVSSFTQGLVKLNERNEIIIGEHNMTSVPGIFAAGDVSNVPEKQIIIAAGEGAKAALGAAEYLSQLVK